MYSLSRAFHSIPLRSHNRRLSTTSKEFLQSAIGIAHTLTRHPKDLPPNIRGTPGRDLSQRYAQLERSLRCKEVLVKQQTENRENVVVIVDPTSPEAHLRDAHSDWPTPPTFRGFVIPEKPQPPADDECCMSGCAICVYDLYEDSLGSYEESLSTLQSNLRALGVSEADWPVSVRPKSTRGGVGERKAQVLSAFEELERALKAKQEQN